jgi:hypothetical protein
LPEWLYEEGIGENRAALVDADEILEAQIELPGELRAGTIAAGRLTTILIPGRRGIATLASGAEVLLEPIPPKLTEGAALRVEIVREAIPEKGRFKLPKCRATDAEEKPGPSLLERISASGTRVRKLSHFDTDALEEAGWPALVEEALSGEIPFEGGALRMSVTPAMALFDVDGALPPARLALAGAGGGGRAIRRLGIGGSIGIDLPTLAAKESGRPQPPRSMRRFQCRSSAQAVNGFGFLQIVRRRRARLACRTGAGGPGRRRGPPAPPPGERSSGTLEAAPAVIAYLEARPTGWSCLQARIGAPAVLAAAARPRHIRRPCPISPVPSARSLPAANTAPSAARAAATGIS